MRRRILAAATAPTVLAAPAAAEAAKKSYRAEIRRTTGGGAHVKARDYGSLGFGYGSAYAQDQLCEPADIVVTVNARRSRYFGPQDGNLGSDFFYQRTKDARTVQRLVRRRARHGPSRIVRATVEGFAAGYNAYLRRSGRGRLPDPTCRGKRWVRPISDLRSRCSPNHPIAPILLPQGVVSLDGSRPRCRWKRDRDAVAPGIIGPRGLARVTRSDYVENSNDSHRLPAAFDCRGVPRGEALLSYSQSENPTSPYYADQTRLYSRKQWLPMRFTERQIRSDPKYERTVVTGRR